MSAPLPTLAQLLSPFPVHAFLRQYDGKGPALLRPVVSTPLDLARLDALVARTVLTWPAVHVEDAHGAVHPDTYTLPEARSGVAWRIDVGALAEALGAGHRVVLSELQRHHAPTAHLVRAFEQALHMRGSATAVLAPHSAGPRTLRAEGVHRHLLQCSGFRACTVVGPDGHEDTFEVTAGCALYVPPQHAVTMAPARGPSLSVDLTLKPMRARDVAAAELATVSREALRACAPVGVLARPGAASEQWAGMVDELLDDADHQAALESLVDRFVQTRLPSLRGQLHALDTRLEPHTCLRRRPGVMARVVDLDDAVELRFHGKVVRFPYGGGELARYVSESPEWRPADLSSVPEPNRLELAGHLVAEGLCEVLT